MWLAVMGKSLVSLAVMEKSQVSLAVMGKSLVLLAVTLIAAHHNAGFILVVTVYIVY